MPTVVRMDQGIGAQIQTVGERSRVVPQSDYVTATPTASIEDAPIDRIEVYVHVNDLYPSLHGVLKDERDTQGFDTATFLCTGSMSPLVDCDVTGYTFSVEPDEGEEPVPLFVGEVATFYIDEDLAACFASYGWDADGHWQADTYIMHRIIEITDDGFRFQGDNNEVADICLIPRENIIDVLVGLRRPLDLNDLPRARVIEIINLYLFGEE